MAVMNARSPASKFVEKEVLTASRRRCCLCVFLTDRDDVRKGQIAHLNRDPSDSRFQNLVFLCLEHHDEYDGRASQSKGLTLEEVTEYRDRLYRQNNTLPTPGAPGSPLFWANLGAVCGSMSSHSTVTCVLAHPHSRTYTLLRNDEGELCPTERRSRIFTSSSK